MRGCGLEYNQDDRRSRRTSCSSGGLSDRDRVGGSTQLSGVRSSGPLFDDGATPGGSPGIENFFSTLRFYIQSTSILSRVLAVGLSQLMNGPRLQRRSSSGPSPERGTTVRIHSPDIAISDPWFRQGGTGFRLGINRGPGRSQTIVVAGPPTPGINR